MIKWPWKKEKEKQCQPPVFIDRFIHETIRLIAEYGAVVAQNEDGRRRQDPYFQSDDEKIRLAIIEARMWLIADLSIASIELPERVQICAS